MKCQQCSSPLGTPSKNPESKRKIARRDVFKKVKEGPDTTISWVVAFAAFMINFIMAGLSRMSGILYVEFIMMFKIDRKTASMPFSVRSSTMNLLGPVVGILGQKYGVRRVSVIGGLLGVFSSAACFFADDITWLTIMWGGVNGVGTALSTTLTTVIMAQYFEKYKTTAAGISFSGACVGSFVFPPLIEELIAMYGLGGSFLIVAGIIMNVLPAAMILRKPSWVKKANKLKDIESAKEKLESSRPVPNIKNEQTIVDGVDLNYLRTNGDLVVKLLTKDVVDEEASKQCVFPPKDDILKEMEDVYTYVGKPQSTNQTSEVPAKIRVKLECETPPSNGKRSFRMERTSVGDYKHSPIRKTHSDESPSHCKPFVMSRLQELYNKNESQIIPSDEKIVYTKALRELRKLHKLYEAVKSRNVYAMVRSSTVSKLKDAKTSKVSPKDLNTKPEKTESKGIWDSIKNSIKLHTNPLFLLIALCRAVHFSTFIPVVTIIVDYTMDKGLLEEDGKYIIATLSVGDLLGRLCLGWVTDRGFISLPRYMMFIMILQGLFTALLPMVNTKITILPVICIYALLQGSVFVRHSVLIAKYMKPGEQSIASGCVNFLAGLLGFAVPSYVGVLWMGNAAIPGSVETIQTLKDLGKEIIYVTNNSTKARAEYLTKCKNLGLPAKVENIISTSYCVAAFLKSKKFQKKVYVLGSTGITQELEAANIKYLPVGPDPVPDNWIHWLSELQLDPEVGAVVVGFDHHVSYCKITKAASYLGNPETLFIATNKDEQFPTEKNLIIPGAGTFVAAVEVVTGRKSVSLGKPERYMLDCIKEVHPNIDFNRCIMIGDRLNTDIMLGTKHGIRTLLVLTGINSIEDVQEFEKSEDENAHLQVPDYYLQCLGDLKKLIK